MSSCISAFKDTLPGPAWPPGSHKRSTMELGHAVVLRGGSTVALPVAPVRYGLFMQ